jgi:hypothetical protein
MLRNDFVKTVRYKLSKPEAQGSSGCWQDRYPAPAPTERRTTEQASRHPFPVITGRRPSLVIVPSPPICLLFSFPCKGNHPVPYGDFLLCAAGVCGGGGGNRRESGIRTETHDGISSPKWHELVAPDQQTCHQLPALPEGAVYISPPQGSGSRGQSHFPTAAPLPLTALHIGPSTSGPCHLPSISNPLLQKEAPQSLLSRSETSAGPQGSVSRKHTSSSPLSPHLPTPTPTPSRSPQN